MEQGTKQVWGTTSKFCYQHDVIEYMDGTNNKAEHDNFIDVFFT